MQQLCFQVQVLHLLSQGWRMSLGALLVPDLSLPLSLSFGQVTNDTGVLVLFCQARDEELSPCLCTGILGLGGILGGPERRGAVAEGTLQIEPALKPLFLLQTCLL